MKLETRIEHARRALNKAKTLQQYARCVRWYSRELDRYETVHHTHYNPVRASESKLGSYRHD